MKRNLLMETPGIEENFLMETPGIKKKEISLPRTLKNASVPSL